MLLIAQTGCCLRNRTWTAFLLNSDHFMHWSKIKRRHCW